MFQTTLCIDLSSHASILIFLHDPRDVRWPRNACLRTKSNSSQEITLKGHCNTLFNLEIF